MVAPTVIAHSISRKARNKFAKQKNGNGKKTFIISHWNLGSKNWTKKRNKKKIIKKKKKMDELTPSYESLIQGYNITLPKTVKNNLSARLVLLSLKFKYLTIV